jgi:sarcosine oxidase subunit gamma
MPEELRLESPLARCDLPRLAANPPGDARVIATERAFLGHLDVRGDARDARFGAAIERVVGVALPVSANTVVASSEATIWWLGPDEWLVTAPGDRVASLEAELRAALAGVRSAVTDVSSGQTVVVLRGPSAREALSKGCPLDLHPKLFGIGRCAQSHLAKAAILLRPMPPASAYEDSAYEIVFRRSFADYVWAWLASAAAEYGFTVVT